MGLAAALAATALLAHAGERIAARIGDEPLSCASLGAQPPAACALALLRELRGSAEQQFIRAEGLQASAAEIDQVRAYEHAFARHDRDQRARKLEELEARLTHAGPETSAAQHARLVEFHALLTRLAAYEADVDRGVEEAAPELSSAIIAGWVEQAKLDTALYRRHGGAVGLRPAGPYAHEARAALVADYIRRAAVELPDPEIAHHVQAALRAPPALLFIGAEPDFTPFWLRPLRASYVSP
jgi:hypothetical protein